MGDAPLLEVRNLGIDAIGRHGARSLVRDASFSVAHGEAVAIVGESGSGKTLTALTVMGLLKGANLRITSGEVRFEGEDLLTADPKRTRLLRGEAMAMVYQDPMTSLNPLMRVGKQLTEVMTTRGIGIEEARTRAQEGLVRVGIPDPERAMQSFPHQFSGGMRQRIVIALALLLQPRLLVADEPTTALDVTIQQQILALVQREQRANGMGLIWITHDLGVVAQLVDRVIVMYNGSIVEIADRRTIFESPGHPYTQALIGSIPDPTQEASTRLRGLPLDTTAAPAGACPFMPRCAQAESRCMSMPPVVQVSATQQVACIHSKVGAA